MDYESTRKRLSECNYKDAIRIYNLLDEKTADINAKIAKKRLRHLYKTYSKCSDSSRNAFVRRMESILEEHFGIDIGFGKLETADSIIERSQKFILKSKNTILLGKILPVILTIEKELLNGLRENSNDESIKGTKENYNIGPWAYKYLKRYASRLVIDGDYDEYDVFDAYCKIGKRKLKFAACVRGIKIGALFSPKLEEIGRILWMKY